MSPDGSVRVTRTTGSVPIKPRIVVNANFTNARTQRLARRAAIFLFEYFDFGSVPAQFWPIFDKTYDPAAGMDEFLQAVGCDPMLVRRKDPVETRKAQDVIELLVRSGSILHDLPPDIRRVVGKQLESGDYDKVREIAEVVAHLRAALDFASIWAGRTVVASFADLLRTLQRMLSNPIGIAAAEAASAVTLIVKYSDAQRRYDTCRERFEALSSALRDTWPGDWYGTSQEAELRNYVGNYEAVAETMRVSVDLTWENLNEGNETLRANLNALDDLLQRARDFVGAPHGRDRGGAGTGRSSGTSSAADDKDAALRYFGFSAKKPPRSKLHLREAWARKLKPLHPDKNPGADEAELARLRDELERCQQFYNMLLIHFGWH